MKIAEVKSRLSLYFSSSSRPGPDEFTRQSLAYLAGRSNVLPDFNLPKPEKISGNTQKEKPPQFSSLVLHDVLYLRRGTDFEPPQSSKTDLTKFKKAETVFQYIAPEDHPVNGSAVAFMVAGGPDAIIDSRKLYEFLVQERG